MADAASEPEARLRPLGSWNSWKFRNFIDLLEPPRRVARIRIRIQSMMGLPRLVEPRWLRRCDRGQDITDFPGVSTAFKRYASSLETAINTMVKGSVQDGTAPGSIGLEVAPVGYFVWLGSGLAEFHEVDGVTAHERLEAIASFVDRRNAEKEAVSC